jgi:hypothetical protein
MSVWTDAVLALSPNSFWRFEGASPLADSGSSGFTLTATGSPVRTTSLVPGEASAVDNAYDLDGSTMNFRVAGGVDDYYFADTDFTLSMWVKPESTPTDFVNNFRRLMSKFDNIPLHGWTMHFAGTAANPSIALGMQVSGFQEANITVSPAIVQDGVYWVVYTWVDSTTTATLYVNGTSQGSDSSWSPAPGLQNPSWDLYIGTRSDSPSVARFNGVIDDVAIWKTTALSSTQIGDLWTAANDAGVAEKQTFLVSRRRTVRR